MQVVTSHDASVKTVEGGPNEGVCHVVNGTIGSVPASVSSVPFHFAVVHVPKGSTSSHPLVERCLAEGGLVILASESSSAVRSYGQALVTAAVDEDTDAFKSYAVHTFNVGVPSKSFLSKYHYILVATQRPPDEKVRLLSGS